MALDLNDTKEYYKRAVGSGLIKIPELVTGRNSKGEVIDIPRVLLSVGGLAERRVNSPLNYWRDNYFFLGDAFAYSAGGERFKAVLNSEHLRNVNGNTRLINGAIPLEDGVYDTLEGEEFVFAEVKKYIGRDLSPHKQKGNPIWAAFIPDEALRTEYIDRMSEEMKQRFRYDKIMGVFPGENAQGVAIIRPAIVYGLEDGRSELDGRGGVGSNVARWVGVAPEAPSAVWKGSSKT